ncbi:uncharacterized protein L203_104082 [Cryptococcus depauperatus CBS 7841]|uniref:Uncharacterized protein n=1 Tax=Cryptococcus depauperatus CBS 7841 TaxID=1295531 RepID=A0AAJ8JUV3_9TREE
MGHGLSKASGNDNICLEHSPCTHIYPFPETESLFLIERRSGSYQDIRIISRHESLHMPSSFHNLGDSLSQGHAMSCRASSSALATQPTNATTTRFTVRKRHSALRPLRFVGRHLGMALISKSSHFTPFPAGRNAEPVEDPFRSSLSVEVVLNEQGIPIDVNGLQGPRRRFGEAYKALDDDICDNSSKYDNVEIEVATSEIRTTLVEPSIAASSAEVEVTIPVLITSSDMEATSSPTQDSSLICGNVATVVDALHAENKANVVWKACIDPETKSIPTSTIIETPTKSAAPSPLSTAETFHVTTNTLSGSSILDIECLVEFHQEVVPSVLDGTEAVTLHNTENLNNDVLDTTLSTRDCINSYEIPTVSCIETADINKNDLPINHITHQLSIKEKQAQEPFPNLVKAVTRVMIASENESSQTQVDLTVKDQTNILSAVEDIPLKPATPTRIRKIYNAVNSISSPEEAIAEPSPCSPSFAAQDITIVETATALSKDTEAVSHSSPKSYDATPTLAKNGILSIPCIKSCFSSSHCNHSLESISVTTHLNAVPTPKPEVFNIDEFSENSLASYLTASVTPNKGVKVTIVSDKTDISINEEWSTDDSIVFNLNMESVELSSPLSGVDPVLSPHILKPISLYSPTNTISEHIIEAASSPKKSSRLSFFPKEVDSSTPIMEQHHNTFGIPSYWARRENVHARKYLVEDDPFICRDSYHDREPIVQPQRVKKHQHKKTPVLPHPRLFPLQALSSSPSALKANHQSSQAYQSHQSGRTTKNYGSRIPLTVLHDIDFNSMNTKNSTMLTRENI